MEPSAEYSSPDTVFSIELTNGMQSIKELYFTRGRGSVFSYKHTKAVLLTSFIFILFSGLFYLLSFSNKIEWVVLFSLTNMVVVVCLIIFSMRARKYFKWKNSVNEYLRQLSKYEKQYLNLNSQCFEVVNEDETVIEKWKNIRKASISPTHITLNSETGTIYLFPAKAMGESKYAELKDFILKKLKDPDIVN
jgi:c-di-AMP phosphodiesterase-like protein